MGFTEFGGLLVKRGISFRWDDRTIDLLNQGAEKTNISKTAFAEDAIQLYSFLVSKPQFKRLSFDEIKAQISMLLESNSSSVVHNLGSTYHESRRPGYVINLIYNYLEDNAGVSKSTNEIAKDLKVPKSTVRSYLRKLVTRFPTKFVLIEGRPNQIMYQA